MNKRRKSERKSDFDRMDFVDHNWKDVVVGLLLALFLLLAIVATTKYIFS